MGPYQILIQINPMCPSFFSPQIITNRQRCGEKIKNQIIDGKKSFLFSAINKFFSLYWMPFLRDPPPLTHGKRKRGTGEQRRNQRGKGREKLKEEMENNAKKRNQVNYRIQVI